VAAALIVDHLGTLYNMRLQAGLTSSGQYDTVAQFSVPVSQEDIRGDKHVQDHHNHHSGPI
jgi:hypothetical protein